MNWEQRVKRYLDAFDYTLLGFDGGLVFYRDKNDRVWGSNEEPLNRVMVEWEVNKK